MTSVQRTRLCRGLCTSMATGRQQGGPTSIEPFGEIVVGEPQHQDPARGELIVSVTVALKVLLTCVPVASVCLDHEAPVRDESVDPRPLVEQKWLLTTDTGNAGLAEQAVEDHLSSSFAAVE